MHHVREGQLKLIKALVDANRRITTREIGLRLNFSNSTVYDHLKGLGLSSELDVLVRHVLTERNLCHRIDVCDSLLKRHKNYPFLKRIITGDEKGHGAKKMNRLKPFPKPIFTKKGPGSNPGGSMDVCKCIVPSRLESTLRGRRAANPLVRLVEGEERWESPDHPHGVLPQNWDGTEQNRTVTCMA
ncbi:mariner transposase [Trichonephila clavipes]|nr:mariner transposase [Trichonephila clavipes]